MQMSALAAARSYGAARPLTSPDADAAGGPATSAARRADSFSRVLQRAETTAQRAMTRVLPKSYRPIAAHRKVYDRLYRLYRQVHDAFGGLDRQADLSGVMKELLELKHAARR